MREEIRNTWMQSEEDFRTAELIIEVGRFYASVFFSQQAAEKALKALYIYQKKLLPKTHNIVELASDLEAPDEVIEACQELNPDYVATRYVDAANGIPAQMYSRNSAITHLEYAKAVIAWTKKHLPSLKDS
ncbi:TPA: HEPN domain-containing protein [Candidatus Poribacteria bacterium]|nr:HEPN domain-containing protein [Candidatus Poribacteria bacterium]